MSGDPSNDAKASSLGKTHAPCGDRHSGPWARWENVNARFHEQVTVYSRWPRSTTRSVGRLVHFFSVVHHPDGANLRELYEAATFRPVNHDAGWGHLADPETFVCRKRLERVVSD